MRNILVGFGEVGAGVFKVLSKHHEIEVHDPKLNYTVDEFGASSTNILMVAIPYSDLFEEVVFQYQRVFNAKHTVVFSSVPVGTCSLIGAVHSPIEGRHSDIADYIEKHDRWVGGNDPEVIRFFQDACFSNIIVVDKPEITEFFKLRSTTYYGLCIEFARYTKAVCDEIGMDYAQVKMYDSGYNELNRAMGVPHLQRYVLDPPEGEIGGHCILPNIDLLKKQKVFSMLLDYIKAVNSFEKNGIRFFD